MNTANLIAGGDNNNPNETSPSAPGAIKKAVACLPPDQMFELMKQMKTCIQNNPQEARMMLVKNPPLAYALLQAQVVMNITDPAEAVKYLTKQTNPPFEAPTSSAAVFNTVPIGVPPPVSEFVSAPPAVAMPVPAPMPVPLPVPVPAPGPVQPPISTLFSGHDTDFRSATNNDPRLGRMNDFDLRRNSPMNSFNQAVEVKDPRQRPVDPRVDANRPFDPRLAKGSAPPPVPRPVQHPNASNFAPAVPTDKTALIRQVLQLSDDQIALLPPEQRASIMVLKEQIAKSAQR